MKNNRPLDFHVRQQALDVNASYAVAAPAGSGKTGLLTLRLLKLLCLSEQPEEVLCITFTRKAAAEMRERLLHALHQAQQPLPEDAGEHAQMTHQLAQQVLERDHQKNWQLQTMPSRLRIQTIDSFCRSLASQLPIASALGADLATLDDPAQAYRQAVSQLLDQYAAGSEDFEGLEVLIRHLDNQLNRLEDLLAGLLANRDQWMAHLFRLKYGERAPLESAMRSWGRELVDKVTQDLAPFAGELLESVRYAASNLELSHPGHELLAVSDLPGLPGDSDADIKTLWRPLIDLLLTGTGTWRKRLDKNCGFVAGSSKEEKALAKARKDQFINLLGEMQERPCLLENLVELRCFPGSEYTEAEWILLKSLTAVLPRLVAELKLVFRQLGATDFVEITEAALAALGGPEEPTDLALKLDYRIQHILVDEFQDTSTPQLSLLEKLTEGWQPDDGRTLFVVGDGMQSCYGFRDANVGIFLDIRKHGLPSVVPHALDLTVNFRSCTAVVEWVNRVFSEAFPTTDDIGRGAVRYSRCHSNDDSLATRAVKCIGFTDQIDHAEEAVYLTEQIVRIRTDHPDQSVAVLVRSRAHLQDLVPALAAAGIPYRAVDIDPLLSRMAVVDALSLTRALLDPSDRIAWLSVLRAPWCGLSNQDLDLLVNTDLGELNSLPRDRGYSDIFNQLCHFDQIAGLSAHAVKALSRLREQMQLAWATRRRKPLGQWVQGVWLALGGPASTTTATDREDIQTYFRLLELHDQAGTIGDWQQFQAALTKLFARPAQGDDNPVELMTIHKSKGLEFDHVFLPGLDRGTRGDDSPLLLWHQRLSVEGEKQLVIGPITASEEEAKAPLYQFLMREKKIKNRLEDTRLLYVACTRARQSLYLTANLQLTDEGAVKPPSGNCLLARIWPQIEQEVELRSATTTRRSELLETQVVHSHIQRLTADWQLPQPAFEAPLSHLRGRVFDNTDAQVAEDNPFANRAARHEGTLWHRLFRRLTIDGLRAWNTQRVEQQRTFWLAQGRQLGLTAHQAQTLIARMEAVLEALRRDPQAGWVFDPAHRDSQCELPLVSRGGRQKLVVDRTFIDQERRWIIDYKSAVPAPGQTLERFLAEQSSSYREQLLSYGRAFATIEQHPQSLALYFPLLPQLVVVEERVFAPAAETL